MENYSTGENMTRPLWPYFKWTRSYVEGSEIEIDEVQKHTIFKCGNNEPVNGLGTFLHVFDQDLQVYETEKGRAVVKEIDSLMETAVYNLEGRNPLFRRCRLLKTGSVTEGTKVGEMNEFDFLLQSDIIEIKDINNIPEGGTFALIKVKQDAKYLLRNYIEELELHSQEEDISNSPPDGALTIGNGQSYANINAQDTDKHFGSGILEYANSVYSADYQSFEGEQKSALENKYSNGSIGRSPSDGALNIGNGKIYANINAPDVDKHFGNGTLEHANYVNDAEYQPFEGKQQIELENKFSNGPVGRKVLSGVVADKMSVSRDVNILEFGTTDIQNKSTSVTSSDNFVVKHVKQIIVGLFLDEVRKVLDISDKWKLVYKSQCSSSIAITLHLTSENYNININIDICLCSRIVEEDIDYISAGSGPDKINDERFIKENKLYFSYIKSVMRSDPELEVFAIIGDDEILAKQGEILTRITIPSLEMSPFSKCGRQSVESKTFRYAKSIAERFFPKPTGYRCPLKCKSSIIKSYHLKNIILYMMNNHKDPALWSDANLPNRVTEVFDILAQCTPLEFSYYSDAAYIAVYNLPGTLRVYNFYNYSPSKYFRDETERALYSGTPGGVYVDTSCSWPEYSDTLQTGNAVIDKVLKSYFDELRTEHWTSTSLILKVRDLLHKLREIRACDSFSNS